MNDDIFLNPATDPQNFDQIRIKIASPKAIRSWSRGEVKKPETINYRTFKPEPHGLFCDRIFGTVKDYECRCGKYRRRKYQGITCEKCGVEVTSSKVRRERMGHIDLAAPVAHIWFLKSLPSRISTLLNMTIKEVEKILYFENYVVTNPGMSPLVKYELLTDEGLRLMQDEYGEDSFETMIGAEAVEYMLKELDLKSLLEEIRQQVSETNSESKKKKLLRRLKLVEDFLSSGNKPEWMVLRALPVIPPEIRPLVMLDGGRFATSDLNELYRRVINRNNRLARLIDLKAPGIIIRNEKRMLQESVDALFDNGRRGKTLKNSNKRPFKSLSDMLKGKQGRFRQNLLGKRVDYSGRSVIVVGPELKLHQCGLPKKMALELFKPFVYSKLVMYGIAVTLKAAKRIVEQEKPEVWDILSEVIKEHPVLLNRAPTLHRLGIQAFEPMLIEGHSIRLHPLVCGAFNADFDGDQMAVHIPLSIEAQLEARVLMMSTNNILSPANGKPIIVPDKDIVLGIYYLTIALDGQIGEGRYFADISEIYHAIHSGKVTIHTKIKVRKPVKDEKGNISNITIETTPGRMILADLVPKTYDISFDLINKPMAKKDVVTLIDMIYRNCKQKATVIFTDKVMELGFKYATQSGISFGFDDMVVPATKQKHIDEAYAEVKEFEQQYTDGLITWGERYNKVIDTWSHCSDKVASDMMKNISDMHNSKEGRSSRLKLNSIYIMAIAGARGSTNQLKQLAGMRGLMATPSGEIIETPITYNFKEGLPVAPYFNSTHGARKGLVDTALKTANSGHLTRRLVDVAQDCIVVSSDCKTSEGITIKPIIEGGEVVVSLAEQALGRCVLEDVFDPSGSNLIIAAGELIDEAVAEKLESYKIGKIKVRSVLTCGEEGGVCAKCYGRDLSNGVLVSLGEAVGVIAAQSIGEPGTQLTMRTFHIGGAATKDTEASSVEAFCDAIMKIINKNIVVNSSGKQVVMSRSCEISLVDDNGDEKARYKVPYGAVLLAKEGERVSQRQKIAEWDPYTMPIITEKSGKILLNDLVEGVSLRDVTDETTGISNKVVIESKQHGKASELRPNITLLDGNGNSVMLDGQTEARYYLPVNAILNVDESSEVLAGDIIARIPRESSKTKDITGGLPRVIELVEARKPKDHAVIATQSGRIEFGKDYKSKRRLILHPDNGSEPIEYMLPKGRYVLVNEGDKVVRGDMLIEGSPELQDILQVMGVEALSRHMVKEIQSVYRLQGVVIDDKHIEVIIKQMLQKSEVVDPGSTNLAVGDLIDRVQLRDINMKAKSEADLVKTIPVLQGITKASLQTNSFISAASFQETTKVLTEAAVAGKIDRLKGLKENVIVGRLIPCGTGFYTKQLRQKAAELDKEMQDNQ